MSISIHYHQFDLPNEVKLHGDIAIDTEAMGLNIKRDRLCVVQLSDGNGDIHLVHFPKPIYNSPNLASILEDKNRVKIMHFARFDLAILQYYLQIDMDNIFCTKIASRLSRTYTDYHGLKDLCHELLEVKISKQQQTSDWGAENLSKDQQSYAASDVAYLHRLRNKLVEMLQREGRLEIAYSCFNFLKTRTNLDISGWEYDIFAH